MSNSPRYTSSSPVFYSPGGSAYSGMNPPPGSYYASHYSGSRYGGASTPNARRAISPTVSAREYSTTSPSSSNNNNNYGSGGGGATTGPSAGRYSDVEFESEIQLIRRRNQQLEEDLEAIRRKHIITASIESSQERLAQNNQALADLELQRDRRRLEELKVRNDRIYALEREVAENAVRCGALESTAGERNRELERNYEEMAQLRQRVRSLESELSRAVHEAAISRYSSVSVGARPSYSPYSPSYLGTSTDSVYVNQQLKNGNGSPQNNNNNNNSDKFMPSSGGANGNSSPNSSNNNNSAAATNSNDVGALQRENADLKKEIVQLKSRLASGGGATGSSSAQQQQQQQIEANNTIARLEQQVKDLKQEVAQLKGGAKQQQQPAQQQQQMFNAQQQQQQPVQRQLNTQAQPAQQPVQQQQVQQQPKKAERIPLNWRALINKVYVDKDDPAQKQYRFDVFDSVDTRRTGTVGRDDMIAKMLSLLGVSRERDFQYVMRVAFDQAAATGSAHDGQGGQNTLEKREMRIFFVYLRQLFELYALWDEVDYTNDNVVSMDEFRKCLPTLQRWGAQIADRDAERVFAAIAGKDGVVSFDEFMVWSLKQQLDRPERD